MEYHAKNLGPYTLFYNEDLDDCIQPLSHVEMDPSMLNLKNDPHKHIASHGKRQTPEVLLSFDREEDHKLRIQLIKFFDDLGGQG